MPIRAAFLVVVLLLASSANAGCTYIASVLTDTLYMDISDGGCGELSISFTRKFKADGLPDSSSIKSYPFADECILKENKNGSPTGLSCRPRGHTPLTGATYKRKRVGYMTDNCEGADHAMIPVYQYVCVKGCAPPVPEILDERNICD